MCAFAGSKSLNESGIHSPKDLLPLPWDTEDDIPSLSDEEYAEMQADIAAWNAQLQKADQQ